MYIPKKLQHHFEPVAERHCDNILVKGRLICCNTSDFTVTYSGRLKKNLIGRKAIFMEDAAVVLVAKCRVCAGEIEVFNSSTDGYDACEGNVALAPLLELTGFACAKCSSYGFSVNMVFEYQSREELFEAGVEEYENAFSWIWISLECNACKKKYKNLIDLETG